MLVMSMCESVCGVSYVNKQWGKCGRWSSRGAGRLSRGVQQSLENEGKSVRERWRGGIKAGGNNKKGGGKLAL